MKAGRKNLRRAVDEREVTLSDGQSIMKAVSIRGSNIIEVMDSHGSTLLALLPAKFQKTLWVGRGSFVVVDDSGKEKALESGSKVGCIVSRVLFYEQVRELQKSADWPEVFRSSTLDSQKMLPVDKAEESKVETDSSDDEGFPPLEPNTNRLRPRQLEPDESVSDSSSDSDS